MLPSTSEQVNQIGAQSDPTKKKTTGPIHNPRYKSILCDHWERTGTCPYAEKCQFAHGAQELAKWQQNRVRFQQNQQQQMLQQHASPNQMQSPGIWNNQQVSPPSHPLSPPLQLQTNMTPLQLHSLTPAKTINYDQYYSSPFSSSTTSPFQPSIQQQTPSAFNGYHQQQTAGIFQTPQQQDYLIQQQQAYYLNRPTPSDQQQRQQQVIPPSASSTFSTSSSYQPQQRSSVLSRIPLYERSPSPDDDSTRSQGQAETQVRAGDPRRTASLPQLFSRDFLSSTVLPTNATTNGTTDISSLGSARTVELPSPPPQTINYPNYRRGSAPPVVLSVVTNSLADLDSLADELVSEPATSTSQLFSMPTVFPGSIKGSINEYL